MDPVIIQKSIDPEILTTTRKINDYASKSDHDKKELERSNDFDIQRFSSPEISKSRDQQITKFKGSRDSMDPAIIQ